MLRFASMTLTVMGVLLFSATALADPRTDYLVSALQTSPMFRVRAQAAISLGTVPAEPQVIRALTSALRDEHPGVRAAAAASLERQGDPSALPALRAAQNDREPQVRSAVVHSIGTLETMSRTHPRTQPLPPPPPPSGGRRSRYYVGVGTPGTRVAGLSSDVLRNARGFIERTASAVDGVEIAPENESARSASRVTHDRNLVGYYLDASIVAIEPQPGGGLRVRVSVVLQSYPDRNIRSMLNGAATVTGASGATAQQQAIEGALRGALRALPQAMQAGAGPR